MKGTLVNVVTVLAGSGIGLVIGGRLPERWKGIITDALGLATLLIGMKLAFKAENLPIVIGSLVVGGLLGEWWDLEGRLARLGEWLRRRVGVEEGSFVAGFMTASLVYCVGPMTVVGSIQEGISGSPDILYAKSILDGAASVAFASTLGLGVAFAALTVLVVQGGLTLLGSQLAFLLDEKVLNELTGTGGVLILGIGLLLLDVRRIRVANLLPALAVAVLLATLFR